MAGDQDDIGMRFCHTRGDRPHACLGDEFHANLGPGIHFLEIVNELRQIFD